MELSANAQKILELVEGLTAVELAALVKALEEKFGVSAAATVAVAGAPAEATEAAPKDTVKVELTEVGQSKIAVIKVVKEIMNIDLKAAQELVGKAPVVLKDNVKMEEAEGIKAKLAEAGATVSFK